MADSTRSIGAATVHAAARDADTIREAWHEGFRAAFRELFHDDSEPTPELMAAAWQRWSA